MTITMKMITMMTSFQTLVSANTSVQNSFIALETGEKPSGGMKKDGSLEQQDEENEEEDEIEESANMNAANYLPSSSVMQPNSRSSRNEQFKEGSVTSPDVMEGMSSNKL